MVNLKSTKVLIVASFIITIFTYAFKLTNASNLEKEHDSKNNTTRSETNQNKALIVIEDWNIIETHSIFWDQFRRIKYDIVFKMIDDPEIKLDSFGEKIYDIIVLCVPSLTEEESKNSELGIQKILKHFDDGHNIMIIANDQVNSYLRSLVTEFGVDFDDYDSKVKDSLYLHNLKDKLSIDLLNLRDNSIVVSKNINSIKNVFSNTGNYVIYEGIGMELDSHNHYLFPILKADENSYSVNSQTGLYYNFGDKIKLVAAYQGRNNKRVTITGSTQMCSNQFYFLSSQTNNPYSSANYQFCNEVLLWNSEKTGVLRYDNIRHQRSDGKSLDIYRIKDEIEYRIDIYEYDYITDTWKAYLTDDLQIEYTMMDPFYRLQLKMLSLGKPTYYTSFKVRLIFKFRHQTSGEYLNS